MKPQIAWAGLEVYWEDNVESVMINGEQVTEQGTLVLSDQRFFRIDKQNSVDNKWYPQDKKVNWGKVSKVELKVPTNPGDICLGFPYIVSDRKPLFYSQKWK